MADSATYWGTIAQVVPVLFIAVMIEFRWILSRMSRTDEDFLSSRRARGIYGAVLFAASVGLAYVFNVAIGSIRLGGPADGLDGAVASLVLTASVGLGIAGPGVALAMHATRDIWLGFHRKMPWSKLARLSRSLARAHARLHAQDREIRALSIRMRRDLASLYIDASRYDLHARTLSDLGRSQGLSIVAKMYANADRAKASLDQLMADRPEEFVESGVADFEAEQVSVFRERLYELAQRQSS